MALSPQTPRQHIIKLLQESVLSANDLATLVNVSERQVEDHLTHIVQSIKRDKTKQFLLHPAACRDCRFVFRARNRVTRPSRCPNCKGENIHPPRYEIESTRKI